jgi:hypothetical protein
MSSGSRARAAGAATGLVLLAMLGGCGRRTDPAPSPEPAPTPAPSHEEDPQAWLKATCAQHKCVEWTAYVGEGIGVRMEPRGHLKYCSVTRREPEKDGGRGRVRWISLLGPGSAFYLDGTLMRVLHCDYRYTPEPPDMQLVMTLLVGADAECPPDEVCKAPIPWEEL